MDIEQALKSNDIEVVQLAVNILLNNNNNILNIEDILDKTMFRVDTFDRKYITLKERYGDGIYGQIKKGNHATIKKFDKESLTKLIEKVFK